MASRARCATASLCAAAARRTTNRIAMARIRRPDFVRAKNGQDVPGSPGAYHTAHKLLKSPHGLGAGLTIIMTGYAATYTTSGRGGAIVSRFHPLRAFPERCPRMTCSTNASPNRLVKGPERDN